VAIFVSAGDSLRAAESVGWLAEVEHPKQPEPRSPESESPASPAAPFTAARRRGGRLPRTPAARSPRR
jgi:hypothetical protein